MAIITINVPDCPGCCAPCDLPDTLDALIELLVSCGCVSAGGINTLFDSPTAFNGSFTGIERVPDSAMGGIAAFWRKEIGTVAFTNYSETDCTGDETPGTAYGVIFVLCAFGGLIGLQVRFSDLGYPTSPNSDYPDYIPLLNGGYSAIVTPGTPEANLFTCDGSNYVAGGSGTLIIP